MIFDIQRNSFVDGPGIRTTVFFKGCNLRCQWCHNPESWLTRPQLMRYPTRCTACGTCAVFCPAHAIAKDGSTDPDACTQCGKCVLYCLNDARSLCGRLMTPEEVLALLLPDKPYYENSGGGVTFSGGECMLQIDFLETVLRLARENGLHTAIDTAGNVPFGSFERILPDANLFLYDVKCFTEKRHIEGTGVSNGQILDNLAQLLKKRNEAVWIRIPVIPGFNDDVSEMEKIASFLRSLPKPAKIELLPYHRLGENKSAALGRTPFTADHPAKETMDAFKALFSGLALT